MYRREATASSSSIIYDVSWIIGECLLNKIGSVHERKTVLFSKAARVWQDDPLFLVHFPSFSPAGSSEDGADTKKQISSNIPGLFSLL